MTLAARNKATRSEGPKLKVNKRSPCGRIKVILTLNMGPTRQGMTLLAVPLVEISYR